MKNKWGEKLEPKTVTWHGQQVTVPFNCAVYTDKEVKIQNRFGGEECTVPGYAASVYDTIIGLSALKNIIQCAWAWTGSQNIFQSNIWCC